MDLSTFLMPMYGATSEAKQGLVHAALLSLLDIPTTILLGDMFPKASRSVDQ